MKIFKIISFSLFLFLFFLIGAQASTLNSPIVSDLNPGIKSFSEPFVSGFTDKYTNVLVYIDGNFWSEAETVSAPDRDSFYFFLDKLPSEGEHELFLIARDQNGVLSAPTKQFNFLITHQLNSPKIFESSFGTSVYFYGESSNENFVEMYVDDSLMSTFFIERNSTNSFEFSEEGVSRGTHSVFFVARDNVGRQSKTTSKIIFDFEKLELSQPSGLVEENEILNNSFSEIKIVQPGISDKAVIETFQDEVVVEGVDNIDKKDEIVDSKKNEEEILDNILKEINNDSEKEGGSISEDGEKQSDLQWNLVIFLAFLLAVILWIIWVNREINDEENEQGSSSDNNETKE